MTRQSGFTLIESILAMVLISTILLPTSFWLYRSHASSAAWEKFQAVQILESRMNRAFLLRADKDILEEVQEPSYLRVDIKVKIDGKESKLVGTAKNRKGKELVRLEALYFYGKT